MPEEEEPPRCRVCDQPLQRYYGRLTHVWSNAIVCVQPGRYTCWADPVTGELALATLPDEPVRYSRPRKR